MSEHSTLRLLVHRSALLILCVALGLTVLGGRWTLIERFGTDAIEWDQWDAEGQRALLPYLNQQNFWAAIFTPHNEHRVVLTKLTNLAVTLANGQWDQRLQAVVNALYPVVFAVGATLWILRRYSVRWAPASFLVLSIGLAGPLAWQNVLGGFHSQQSFLILTAVLTIGTLPFVKTASLAWWVGAVSALLGLGTMGSGLIAPAGVVGLIVLRTLCHRTPWKPHIPALALCLAAVAVGWFTRVDFVGHEALHAQNARDFVSYLYRSLTWPLPEASVFGLVFWLPWVALFVKWGLEKNEDTRKGDLVLLGMGGWVLVQLVATSWMRGGGSANGPVGIAPRYADTLLVGIFANLGAIFALAQVFKERLPRGLFAIFVASWLGLFTTSALLSIQEIITKDLEGLTPYRRESVITTRAYLHSRSPSALQRGAIPYPNSASYEAHLRTSAYSRILPSSVRTPLAEWDSSETGPFRPLKVTDLANAHAPAVDSDGVSGLPSHVVDWGAEPTWSSFGQLSSGTFRSLFVRSEASHGRIDVIGTWSDPGVELQLQSARGGDVLATLRPAEPVDGVWQEIVFSMPGVPFVLVAKDSSPSGWLAFTGIREMPLGSALARQATLLGLQVLAVGLGLGLSASLVLLFWPATSHRHPTPSSPS